MFNKLLYFRGVMLKVSENKRWPSGDYRDIATVCISDEEIEHRTGQSLLRGVEQGLGPWVSAGGKMVSGLDVELLRYTEAPAELSSQYIIRVDKKANHRVALEQVLGLLQLKLKDLDWVFDEAAI
jgi:hypothetical protein